MTSVEDTWNSVTKRSMLVYDAILMAGQTKISYGYDLHKALETASAADKWVGTFRGRRRIASRFSS